MLHQTPITMSTSMRGVLHTNRRFVLLRVRSILRKGDKVRVMVEVIHTMRMHTMQGPHPLMMNVRVVCINNLALMIMKHHGGKSQNLVPGLSRLNAVLSRVATTLVQTEFLNTLLREAGVGRDQEVATAQTVPITRLGTARIARRNLVRGREEMSDWIDLRGPEGRTGLNDPREGRGLNDLTSVTDRGDQKCYQDPRGIMVRKEPGAPTASTHMRETEAVPIKDLVTRTQSAGSETRRVNPRSIDAPLLYPALGIPTRIRTQSLSIVMFNPRLIRESTIRFRGIGKVSLRPRILTRKTPFLRDIRRPTLPNFRAMEGATRMAVVERLTITAGLHSSTMTFDIGRFE